jgi:hypothetical protein
MPFAKSVLFLISIVDLVLFLFLAL